MFKKLLLCVTATSVALGFNSCSNEIEAPATGEDGMVLFTAKMPGSINSRAYSDGKGANRLSYAVYEAGTENVIYASDQTDAPKATYNNNLTFTLALKLVKGQNYDLIFWADNDESQAYIFDPATKSISIDYNNIKSSDETSDAFFTAEKDMLVTGAMQRNIQLYRPFAQLNIGTDDIEIAERAGTSLGMTQVVVKDVYSQLNLFTGEASDPTDVTYAYAERPDDERFPVAGYEYLSMNYILTGEQILDENVNSAQKETKDITLSIQDADGKPVNEFNVSAVPFQRNYRTNIYGSLLTSTVDFIIEIIPDYNDPDNDVNLNGYIIDEDNKTVSILNINGLMWLRNETNTASNSFKGYTVTLQDDIDLGNIDWTPIGINSQGKDKNTMNWFEGTFDGQGHTISNLKCHDEGNYSIAGLFGAIRGNIKNLKINGADIRSNHYAGTIAAYAHANNASLYNDITFPADGFFIENCEVSNATVTTTPNKQANGSYDNGDKAGVLMGYTNTIMTISGCKVSNSTVEAYRDLGALIGYIGGSQNGTLPIRIDNNMATDIRLIQNYTNGYKDESAVAQRHGTWYGWKDYDPASCENNTESNVTYEVFVTEGVAMDAEGNYVVNTPAGITWIATQVNAGANNFSGKTLKLGNDIDMAGIEYEPIGHDNTNSFCGTFDGQGHTISNLSMTNPVYENIGFIGRLSKGTVKNLRLANVTIENATTHYGTAAVVGSVYPSGLVTGCEVDGASLSGNRRIGGITGYTYGNVTDCKVNNATITANPEAIGNNIFDNGDKAGGITGMLCESNYTFTGNIATNCRISAFRDLGGVVGHAASPVKDCTCEDTEISYISAPGNMADNAINNNIGEVIGRYATSVDNCIGNNAVRVTLNK